MGICGIFTAMFTHLKTENKIKIGRQITTEYGRKSDYQWHNNEKMRSVRLTAVSTDQFFYHFLIIMLALSL